MQLGDAGVQLGDVGEQLGDVGEYPPGDVGMQLGDVGLQLNGDVVERVNGTKYGDRGGRGDRGDRGDCGDRGRNTLCRGLTTTRKYKKTKRSLKIKLFFFFGTKQTTYQIFVS